MTFLIEQVNQRYYAWDDAGQHVCDANDYDVCVALVVMLSFRRKQSPKIISPNSAQANTIRFLRDQLERG